MADIKFSCPHCQQHIQADSGYAGVQINCPACNGAMMVPGTPAPAPAPTQYSAPPPPPPPPPPQSSVSIQRPAAAGGGVCPSCGAGLARGAVLCTQCGYNLVTKQRMVAGRPAAMGKAMAPAESNAWYKSPYPYVGALLAVLAVLYYLGRENPVMMLAFLGVSAIYYLIVFVMVLVAAFQDGVGTGFMTLCIPFYAVYFVFKVHDNDTLKVLYGVAFLLGLIFRFISPH
jgi:hypothetical protein